MPTPDQRTPAPPLPPPPTPASIEELKQLPPGAIFERPAELVVPDRRTVRKRSRRTTDRPDDDNPSKQNDRRKRGSGSGMSLPGGDEEDEASVDIGSGDGLDHFSREERRVFHGHVMIARQVALAFAILVVSFLTGAPDRLALLAALGGLWVVGGLYQLIRLKTRGELPATLPWVDCFANLAMLAIAPRALPMILVLGFAQLTLAVVAYSTMHAFFAATCVIVGVPFISFVSGEPDPMSVAAVAAFGVFVPVIAGVSHRMRQLEGITRRRYLDLMGGFDAVVWEADPETLELLLVGPQVRTVFGMEPHEFARRYVELIHPDDRETEEALRRGGVEGGETRFAVDYRMVDKSGDTISVRNTIAVELNEAGERVRVRGVITDVTRQQEAEATIRKQAQYDTLTGLPNRSLFNEQLRRRLEECRRTGDELAVLLLDLNGFKEVNDTLGHAVGDILLQSIAGRLAAYMPERSTVARLGGDEFAVVISPASARAAASIAETIASCLQPPITVDDMTIQAGASTGIAVFPTDGETPAALMRRADAAMYEAKQSGRTHMFATPDDDTANVRRLQLLGELRASITSGDFRLFHQPKVDLKSGRIVGTEGLIRWKHRQFGMLSPGEFVELSELSGLIQPLTRWILDRGIRDLSEWRAKGFELTVALNLSVRNFFDQTLPTYIAQLLSDYGVPGDQLCLEITESEVMADRALARTALAAFRSLGVKIAIDDFGTGFSSLSQLQQLPIDEIKVDQSFVSGMIDNPQDAVIVRSIIELGHNLGLEVVAEGAEDEVQLAALRSLGADRVQGYVISRPLPPDEFIPWLERMERGEGTSGSSTVPGAGRFTAGHLASEQAAEARPTGRPTFINTPAAEPLLVAVGAIPPPEPQFVPAQPAPQFAQTQFAAPQQAPAQFTQPQVAPVPPQFAQVQPQFAPVQPQPQPQFAPVQPQFAQVQPQFAPVQPQFAPVQQQSASAQPQRAPAPAAPPTQLRPPQFAQQFAAQPQQQQQPLPPQQPQPQPPQQQFAPVPAAPQPLFVPSSSVPVAPAFTPLPEPALTAPVASAPAPAPVPPPSFPPIPPAAPSSASPAASGPAPRRGLAARAASRPDGPLPASAPVAQAPAPVAQAPAPQTSAPVATPVANDDGDGFPESWKAMLRPGNA